MRLKFIRYLAVLPLLATLATPAGAAPRFHAVAKLIGLDGREIGRAAFSQVSRGVLIEIKARALPPGPHAVMIHTSAECNPQKQFYTAGPDLDFDPPRPHGYLVIGGPRPGDLPNQFAGTDGVLHASVFVTTISLGNGKTTLFDRDGASIIIHAKADDYRTAPDGNSGARLACGTIVRTIGPKPKHKKPPDKK